MMPGVIIAAPIVYLLIPLGPSTLYLQPRTHVAPNA